jgi:phosphatidylglycerol lysyltransferase
VWGTTAAIAWFALGMAPLSGVEHSPVHSFWNRIGGFLYEHGEALYRFQGLRGYKEKFDPGGSRTISPIRAACTCRA